MTPRYKDRIPIKAKVTFSVGSQVGQGVALDLTVPGCRIESGMAAYKSQSLQLKMFLPGLKSPLLVALAIVRWTNGTRFGVEFIKMDPSQRQVLNRYVAPVIWLSGHRVAMRLVNKGRTGTSARTRARAAPFQHSCLFACAS